MELMLSVFVASVFLFVLVTEAEKELKFIELASE